MTQSPPQPPFAAPSSAELFFSHLFELRPATIRLPFAVRTALCMGVPVAFGYAVGDVAAGLVATLGSFTALYGSDRPYRNRAAVLAVVAASLMLVVSTGASVHGIGPAVVADVILIAMVSTFLCNACMIGPPGAYIFSLAGAAGTALPVEHLHLLHIAALVLSGGAFSWIVQMSGVLIHPRAPERAAVSMAATALARFADVVGTPAADNARHMAALALHQLWTTLVALQPKRNDPDPVVRGLRSLGRELHRLFAQLIDSAPDGAQAIGARARAIASLNVTPDLADQAYSSFPLGRYDMRQGIREALKPGSVALWATARVGVAASIGATLGSALDPDRAYWVVAASVLVLHQGLDWARTVQRSIARIIGTFLGLGVAGLILQVGPRGYMLALTLAALQFSIEMLVSRNYALAVIFITPAALVIAAGAQSTPDIPHLLWTRGVDTFLGCTIALAVHFFLVPSRRSAPVVQEMLATLAATERVLGYVAEDDVVSVAPRQARRELQHRAFALLSTFEAAVGSTTQDRERAERIWPAVVAVQRLAYRVLAGCWSLETGDRSTPAAQFGKAEFAQTRESLAAISGAMRSGNKPVTPPSLPPMVELDIRMLGDSIVAMR